MTDEERKLAFVPDQEAQLEAALEVAPVWVFEQDAELRYLWLQNAETRGLGGGATDADLLEDPRDAAAVEALKRQVLRTGRGASAEVVTHVEGAPHRHRLRVTPRRGPDGRIVGLVGATVDLGPVDGPPSLRPPPRATSTDLPPTPSTSALLRLVGHELRNAVNPLRMALQLSERRHAQGDPRALDGLPSAYAGVERLTHLLQDLLDYAHSQTEPLHVDRPPTRVEVVLEITRARFALLHPRAKDALRVTAPPGPLAVLGDRKRVAQLLLALLDRPARVREPDRPIDLEIRAGPDHVTFEVRDSGPPPPGSVRLALEDPAAFAAACLAAERDEPPFALALARALAEALGGELLAGPGPDGAGLWTRARLPRADMPAETPPVGQLAPRRRRILVVDDDAGAPEALRRLLEADGHAVVVAENGQGALREASAGDFDVILLDLGLPDLSGHEVARRLRSHAQRAVLVALTGRSSEVDRRASLAAGFDHHLVKPVELRGLRSLLARL